VAAVLVAVLLARAGDGPGEPADLPEAQEQLRDEIKP
jgi:hypothetical protein